MAELKLDDASIIEGLQSAEAETWSGILRVLSGRDQVGAIVMRDGRVAWAVCKYQREDLGSFLVRRGVLSKEQLGEVSRRYEALGRTRKLASLLAEAGVAKKETLNACLHTHVRRALKSMLAIPGCTLSARGGALKVVEELSFTVDSLLADGEDDGESRAPGAPLPAILDVLQTLAVLPGYQRSLVGQLDGHLVAADGPPVPGRSDELLVGLPAAFLRTATETAEDGQLGALGVAVLEGSHGMLLTCWVRRETGVFLALFLGGDGRLGVAKHRVSAATAALYPLVAAVVGGEAIVQRVRESCSE
jgi:hypothetical protein